MIKGLRLLKIKDQHNISEAAFNEILEVMEISRITLYKLWKFLGKQVPIEPNLVDCCVNSCVAFTGENTNKDRCPTCNEERYKVGKNREKLSEGRKKAAYWSVINSLQMQYNDKKRAQLLRYRNEYINTDEYSAENKIGDVFDGLCYKNLTRAGFFTNRRDVALLGSMDGFQLFRQKRDDCWVVLLINANLPPEIRVERENLIIAAMFPGPKAPMDFNLFLRPLVNELKQLQGKKNSFLPDNFRFLAKFTVQKVIICADNNFLNCKFI